MFLKPMSKGSVLAIPFVNKLSIRAYSILSANGVKPNLDSNENDALSLERQREFSHQINMFFKEMKNQPLDDIKDFQQIMDVPLTEREQELDKKLEDFLKRYSKFNKVVEPPNSKTHQFQSLNSSISEGFPYLVQTTKNDPYSEQELFLRQLNHSSCVARLGANIENVYFPHKDISKPLPVEKLSIAKLMSAGVHLGQSTKLWRPSTQPYIYGEYRGIHIIDLHKTLIGLKRACKIVEGTANNGGIILFLGTRKGQKPFLQKAAQMVNGYYVASRWIPGTLTNPTEISGVWERHEVDFTGNPTGRELTPDESLTIVKPDLLIVLNPTENKNALMEAMKVRVPTIGLIDTDSEPSLVSYPIPANDDSLRSVSLITTVLAKAGERGLKIRLKKLETF